MDNLGYIDGFIDFIEQTLKEIKKQSISIKGMRTLLDKYKQNIVVQYSSNMIEPVEPELEKYDTINTEIRYINNSTNIAFVKKILNDGEKDTERAIAIGVIDQDSKSLIGLGMRDLILCTQNGWLFSKQASSSIKEFSNSCLCIDI
jgi:hypothetical protein